MGQSLIWTITRKMYKARNAPLDLNLSHWLPVRPIGLVVGAIGAPSWVSCCRMDSSTNNQPTHRTIP